MPAIGTLHNGRELDILTPYLLEKLVELLRMSSIQTVDHRHGVPLHPKPVEHLDATHHPLP